MAISATGIYIQLNYIIYHNSNLQYYIESKANLTSNFIVIKTKIFFSGVYTLCHQVFLNDHLHFHSIDISLNYFFYIVGSILIT